MSHDVLVNSYDIFPQVLAFMVVNKRASIFSAAEEFTEETDFVSFAEFFRKFCFFPSEDCQVSTAPQPKWSPSN